MNLLIICCLKFVATNQRLKQTFSKTLVNEQTDIYTLNTKPKNQPLTISDQSQKLERLIHMN